MTRGPLLLRIDMPGLDAWQVHDRSLARVATFGAGEHAAFAAWLTARTQRTRCRVLVDLADESFEVEELPRVRGADRRALIARKLGSWFARPEFALATPLGRSATNAGGHFERVLFSGLNRPALIEPWLQAVVSTGHRIERVVPAAHLLAHVVGPVAASFASPRAAQSPNTLVLGFGRSGLRISLLAGQSLAFSRLIEGTWPQTDAQAITQRSWRDELMRTRDYLRAQRRIEADDTPAELLICTGAALARSDDDHALETGGGEAAPIAIDPARLGAVTMRDETGSAIAGDELAALLLHALCRSPARLGWPLSLATSARAGAARRPLLLAGAVLAAALALGGWHWQQSAAQAAHAAAAEATAARLRALQAMREDDLGAAPELEAPRPEDAPAVAAVPTEQALPQSPPDSAVQDSPRLPRRLDGILRRPDGRVFLWVDGQLTDPTSAGLHPAPGHALSVSPREASRTRLRVGDHWPARAQADTDGVLP